MSNKSTVVCMTTNFGGFHLIRPFRFFPCRFLQAADFLLQLVRGESELQTETEKDGVIGMNVRTIHEFREMMYMSPFRFGFSNADAVTVKANGQLLDSSAYIFDSEKSLIILENKGEHYNLALSFYTVQGYEYMVVSLDHSQIGSAKLSCAVNEFFRKRFCARIS